MKDIYFIAIGGVGQSALAKILIKMGYNVSGSDIKESKYTKLIEDLGAKVYIGQNPDNIKGNPIVVISSAIKEDNPELIKAKELNLQIMHRSDCLKFISEHYNDFIGLSGTHGKTTTSGMISFVMEKMNLEPAYAVGGILPKLKINANAYKTSKYFIAELDESDGTIQKYAPKYLLINNLEEDHLDYYKNGLADIISTFKKLISNMKESSYIFANIDNFGVRELLSEIKNKNIISYGINSKACYVAKNINFEELNSSFDIYKQDKFLGKINLIIPGIHNIYNALGVVSILDTLGLNFKEYSKFLSEFSGMGRRFQIVAETKGIKIIDDYAHHPTEIKSTLSALQNTNKRKIAIFQPHRYTRLQGLWEEFLNCFDDVDKLYVTDVFSAGDMMIKDVDSEHFVKAFKNKNIKPEAKYIKGTILEASKQIMPELKEGDIVLTIGAGDITKIGEMINDLLTK